MVRATGLEPACLATYEPKSYVSANSTTPAYSIIYIKLTLYEPKSYVSSCCGTRHSLRLTKQARALPTAATRSARLLRHRRRSHRSPISPHPRIFYRQRKYFTMKAGNCQWNLRHLQSVTSKWKNISAILLDIPGIHR